MRPIYSIFFVFLTFAIIISHIFDSRLCCHFVIHHDLRALQLHPRKLVLHAPAKCSAMLLSSLEKQLPANQLAAFQFISKSFNMESTEAVALSSFKCFLGFLFLLT